MGQPRLSWPSAPDHRPQPVSRRGDRNHGLVCASRIGVVTAGKIPKSRADELSCDGGLGAGKQRRSRSGPSEVGAPSAADLCVDAGMEMRTKVDRRQPVEILVRKAREGLALVAAEWHPHEGRCPGFIGRSLRRILGLPFFPAFAISPVETKALK